MRLRIWRCVHLKKIVLIISFILVLSSQPAFSTGTNDAIYQVSTFNALYEGIYDGNISFKELRKHGDFGIGTFNGLDGEMVALEGKFYQIKSNGAVVTINDQMKTPFSVVKFFRAEKTIFLERSLNYEQLIRYLDTIISSRNVPSALRIDGSFEFIKTRSLNRQSKPYGKLPEILKNQVVTEYRNVKGTIVGFRIPEYMKGINAPGYHFHFLTEDRKFGGHLLACQTSDIKILLDDANEIRIVFPEHGEFYKADLLNEDAARFRLDK